MPNKYSSQNIAYKKTIITLSFYRNSSKFSKIEELTQMVRSAIFYGIFLILWGAGISTYSESKSFTSWIPSLIGLPIFLSSLIACFAPNQKKIWMHVSVFFGFLAFLGGLDFLRGFGSELGPFEKPTAGLSKLMLLITGGIFTFYNIRSFISARKNNIQKHD